MEKMDKDQKKVMNAFFSEVFGIGGVILLIIFIILLKLMELFGIIKILI
jgi:hypothetical protein